MICISVASLLLYSTQAGIRVEEMTVELLLAAVHEQKNLLTVKIDGESSLLSLLATSSCLCTDPLSAEAQKKLNDIAMSSDFRALIATDLQGHSVTSGGAALLLPEREYLTRVLSGKNVIEHIGKTGLQNFGDAFVLAVPIWNKNEIIGAVIGVLDASVLHEMFNQNAYGGSETYLCDLDGNIVVGYDQAFQTDDNDNLFSILRAASMDGSGSAEEIIDDIQASSTGTVAFTIGKDRWYIAYAPSAYEGWFICRTIPSGVVNQNLQKEKTQGFIAIGIALLSAVFIAVYLVAHYNQKIRSSRLERERLMDSEEEYRIATQKRGIMIIRYDIDSGKMVSSSSTFEHFRRENQPLQFDADWVLNELVSAESREAYRSFWLTIRRGEPSGDAEIRMKNAEGEYRWYGFEFSLVKDDAGKGAQAIISIRDITIQQERISSYKRWQNALASSIGFGIALMEVNVSTGACERAEGEFSTLLSKLETQPLAERILARFCDTFVEKVDRQKFSAFVAPQRLLEAYHSGELSKEMEIRMLRADGSRRHCIVTAQMTLDPRSGEIRAFLIVKDLEKITKDIDRLSGLALRDELSGLLNRTAARNAIEEALLFGDGGDVALFMIDADNFKQVNDLLGHQNGDLALRQMSDVIRNTFRSTDIVARIGGDEFFVFLSEVPGEEFAESKARTLCENLRFVYTVEERGSISLSASIGVIVAARGSSDYEWLYSEADRALYDAKNAGKNRYSIRYAGSPAAAAPVKSVTVGFTQQLHSLMKHLDGGLILMEVGESIEPIFISDGFFLKNEIVADAAKNGTFLETVVHPLDVVTVENAIRACAAKGEPFQLSYRNGLQYTGYGWLHMNAVSVPGMKGGGQAVLAVLSDITNLRETTEHIESLAVTSQIGIFIMRIGERLEITFFNDGALAITGFAYEQMRLFSRDASAFFRGANLDRLRAEVAEALAGNRMLRFVYESQGFPGKPAHKVQLFGVKMDVQNGVPSFLMVMLEQSGDG